MSLEFCIGVPSERADLRHELSQVNEALAAFGLPPHHEPPPMPPLRSRARVQSFPYVWLHALRRVVARWDADPGWVWAPCADPEFDAVVEAASTEFRLHTVCHADDSGWYLPAHFTELPVAPKSAGGLVGSAARVLDELRLVAPRLGISLEAGHLGDAEASRISATSDGVAMGAERLTWLALFEAMRLSVEHGSALRFC